MDRFREARNKGCAYLLERLHPNGSFGDPELGAIEYYKVPTALHACGESKAASRLLSWVRRNGMTPDGDFGPRPVDARESFYYIYHNAWVIKGAHRMGQFDLSQKGMDFLIDFWDPESGGFYSSRHGRAPVTMMDLWVVAGGGWSAIYTGRMDVARGVGRWMQTLMEEQPNYPEEMYTVYSRATGLITTAEPGQIFRYVLDNDTSRDQSFYHPGIAGGFLARLYQATGEEQWLELAKEYMRFAETAPEHHFRLSRAGKVGWAASVLFTLTGEAKYRDMAMRVGDNLIEAQSEDGAWKATGTGMISNDATAELVVWLDEIYQAVGGS